MSDIKGLPTHDNLKEAFAGESGTVHRYLYFAKIADIEGYPDVAQLFRELAEGGLHNTHGNLDYLKQAGDPATDMPIGETDRNLAAAIIAEARELDEVYPEMAVQAREDGLTDVASWFETLGKVKRAHVARLRQAVEQMQAMPGDDHEEDR